MHCTDFFLVFFLYINIVFKYYVKFARFKDAGRQNQSRKKKKKRDATRMPCHRDLAHAW